LGMACAIETCPTQADLSATGGKDCRIDFSSGTWSVWAEWEIINKMSLFIAI